MVGLDARLGADDNQALDKIAKFADVARPWIAEKNVHGGVAQFAGLFSVLRAEFVEEVARQRGDVLRAVPQRGNEKRNDVKAIKEVLAKIAAIYFLFEILVRGGDDADIHAHGLIGAHWFEALLFENTQHFGLRAHAHVADFIEEQRAAVGFFELADLVLAGARETAFDMAEEFGLDQFFGDGGAIQFDEGAFAAEAGRVQCPGDEFFAGAAFAIDQDAAVGRCGDGDLLAHGLHGNAIADDLITVAQFAAEQLIFFLEAPLLDGVADQNDNFFKGKWLFEKVECAKFRGPHGGFDGAVTGDHDDCRGPGNGLQTAEGCQSIDARQPDIEKNDFKIPGGGPLERLFGRAHGLHVIALIQKNRRERFTNAGLVIDDQDVRLGTHREDSDPWSVA